MKIIDKALFTSPIACEPDDLVIINWKGKGKFQVKIHMVQTLESIIEVEHESNGVRTSNILAISKGIVLDTATRIGEVKEEMKL